MDIRVDLYRRGLDATSEISRRYKQNITGIERSLDKYLDTRIHSLVLLLLREEDEVAYYTLASEAIPRLVKAQLRRGEEYRSPRGKEDVDDYVEGGFPDRVLSGRKTSDSRYPSPIATALATASILDYALFTGRVDELKATAIEGLAYLGRRDVNRNWLVEQEAEEDWLGLGRGGNLLSTNLAYLSALEKAYNATLETDESGKYEKILTNLINRVEEDFWVGGRFITHILTTSARSLATHIDGWSVALPLAYRGDERMRSHMEHMYRALHMDGKTLVQSPPDRDNPPVYDPLQTSLLAYALAKTGMYNEALTILAEAAPNTGYRMTYIGGKTIRTRNPHKMETEIVIHLAIQRISRAVKE